MNRVKLDEVAFECRDAIKGTKQGLPIVGLDHLMPNDGTLTSWYESCDNTFTKTFAKGQVLFGRRRAYLKRGAVAPFDGICSVDITVIVAKPSRLLHALLPLIIKSDKFFDYAAEKTACALSPRAK
jgi:type I restriction enzyme S subunit